MFNKKVLKWKEKRKTLFVDFSGFPGANIPIIANFKLVTLLEFRRNVHSWLSQDQNYCSLYTVYFSGGGQVKNVSLTISGPLWGRLLTRLTWISRAPKEHRPCCRLRWTSGRGNGNHKLNTNWWDALICKEGWGEINADSSPMGLCVQIPTFPLRGQGNSIKSCPCSWVTTTTLIACGWPAWRPCSQMTLLCSPKQHTQTFFLAVTK